MKYIYIYIYIRLYKCSIFIVCCTVNTCATAKLVPKDIDGTVKLQRIVQSLQISIFFLIKKSYVEIIHVSPVGGAVKPFLFLYQRKVYQIMRRFEPNFISMSLMMSVKIS